ncbi:MAG TPA: cold shock and DUF1294 domain-containing protein [Cellvibrio sp.]|nr:cold shock and DUF1294 domain-containing protein [Cellvibrio sp.]
MTEQEGVIERWDDQKGFGFISIGQGKKVFFHIKAVRGAYRPQQGETVMFQLGKDEQGRPTATHVRSTNLAVDNPHIRIKPTATSANSTTSRSSKVKQTYRLHESSIPWRYLALLFVLPTAGVADLAVNHQSPWGILIYVLVSVLTYYFYWDDKRRAKQNEWRIPEANLHFWALVGGWPGAFIAQQQFRHKTKKLSFLWVFWLIVIAHQAIWFDWLVMDGKWLLSLFPVSPV